MYQADEVKHFEDYVQLAEESKKDKDFPQAMYWYFQAYADHKHSEVQDLVKSCEEGKNWNDFPTFLSQFWSRGDINVNSDWSHVKRLWENRRQIKELYLNSSISMEKMKQVYDRCCRLHCIVNNKDEKATGVLLQWLEFKFIVTNFHVVKTFHEYQSSQDSKEDPPKLVAEFTGPHRINENPVIIVLKDELICSEELDLALLIYDDKAIRERSHFRMDDLGYLESTNAVNIVQHPKGQELHQAFGHICSDLYDDTEEINYKCTTEKGSSGSFVLDRRWKPVALHKVGIYEEDMDGGDSYNSGTKFSAITTWLKDKKDEILKIIKNSNSYVENYNNQERFVKGSRRVPLVDVFKMHNGTCQIVTANGKKGTGFLAVFQGIRFVVTSISIIDSNTDLQKSCAIFTNCVPLKKERGEDEIKEDSVELKVKFTEEIAVNEDLGVSIIGYEDNANIRKRWHFILGFDNIGNSSEIKGTAVVSLQRPENDPQIHQSIGTVKIVEEEKKSFYYDCSARNGTVGSIVLTAEWKPIGIHQKEHPDWMLNEGLLIKPVVEWIMNNETLDNFNTTKYIDDIDKHVIRTLKGKVEIKDFSEKLGKTEDLIEEVINENYEEVTPALDEDDIYLVTSLYTKGHKIPDISRKLGHEEDVIEDCLMLVNKDKVDINGIDKTEKEIILVLWNENLSTRDIARRLSKSEETITEFLKKISLQWNPTAKTKRGQQGLEGSN